MAFPNPPKTWAFQESVESSELNTELRDALLAEGPHLHARKTSDENVTTTTLQDDDNFTFPVAANEVWLFKLCLLVVTGAGGMKSSFSFPASGLLDGFLLGQNDGATDDHQPVTLSASDGSTVSYVSNSTRKFYILEGMYINAGTAGNVVYRNALTTASGTSTVKANSTEWIVKLA